MGSQIQIVMILMAAFVPMMVVTAFREVVSLPNLRRCEKNGLPMISFGGGGKKEPELPRDVKEAVSKCRAAVQEALQNRMSRMDVEMPVGTKFGIEKGRKAKTVVKKDDGEKIPSKEDFDASDRELARIFVEMFQPLGGNHISVVFNEEGLSNAAKTKWKGDSSASCNIFTMGRRSKNRSTAKKKKPRGFAAKMEAEVGSLSDEGGSGEAFKLPKDTELALFVAPGPKELILIEKICNEVGMDTLIVLLNARLSKIENFGSDGAKDLFLQEFEPVFHLRAAPQDVAPGCLLHRSYPGDWVVARKPKVGQPKVILTQPEIPTMEQCRAAYDSIELSEVEKGVENVLENVSGWF
mmetsp:Transcript_13520/g.19947  ORF Transcript_13520/g.19947 Transcript_13520/m.19947 type:complete len:352 (+) Transcript_13520:246-1301(+)|eukprot:CAMPEP_0194208378 /NCGR_PEP_ID=MMETSP0156-20130528/6842_1 /TAXON_ID=33649 /ORGANISM="Thalassionema nitzschioides, Strain L26-B" /LENGTH=351 /DNA_ID=CAMNT_0038935329 /DNA_START=152 /DNA_END=1207 /DNA_ORIENTATION=+